jgi:hypothetical protein
LGQEDSDKRNAWPVILGAVWAKIADFVSPIKLAAGAALVKERSHDGSRG